MQHTTDRKVLVTGATGFIGRALVPALRARGWPVVGASRRTMTSTTDAAGVEWSTCDLLRPETLPAALTDIKVAYYLVHSMGGGKADFSERERRAAEAFVAASAKAGVERIVYLGGPAPRGRPSAHLRSRLQVGEILRAGSVSTVELRASMVIGTGGASWQIVRDLALRLPAMVMPKWLKSRTRPVALDDVIVALVAAADLPLQGSAWFDLPGPEILSGRQISSGSRRSEAVAFWRSRCRCSRRSSRLYGSSWSRAPTSPWRVSWWSVCETTCCPQTTASGRSSATRDCCRSMRPPAAPWPASHDQPGCASELCDWRSGSST